MADDEGPGRTRSDARRNSERVREVALQVLAERGSEATVMDIAREAGVGKATVYRNFPTKAALLAFAAEHHGRWLVDRLDDAITADDGWSGFASLVRDTMQRIRSAPILLDVLGGGERVDAPVGALVDQRLHTLIARLRATGQIRADATVDDLGLLIIGSADYLARIHADERQTDRAAELVLAALRG